MLSCSIWPAAWGLFLFLTVAAGFYQLLGPYRRGKREKKKKKKAADYLVRTVLNSQRKGFGLIESGARVKVPCRLADAAIGFINFSKWA